MQKYEISAVHYVVTDPDTYYFSHSLQPVKARYCSGRSDGKSSGGQFCSVLDPVQVLHKVF